MNKNSKIAKNISFQVYFAIFVFLAIKMDFDANFLVWALSYIFVSFICIYFFNRKKFFAYLINNVLWFKFIIIPSYILAEGKFITSFGYQIEDSFLSALIVSVFFIFIINLGIIFSRDIKVKIINENKNGIFLFEKGLYYLMFLSVSIVIFIKISTIPSELTNRLIENSGKGYLHIIGYLGYFLSFYFFKKGYNGPRSLLFAIMVAFYGGVFFLLLGYRGGFLYSPILIFVFFVLLSRRSSLVVGALPLILILLFEINYITSTIRYLVVTNSDFNYQILIDFYLDYKSKYTVPLAFNHFEYISYWLSNNDSITILLGTWNTVYSSFFNWIPSFLIENKPLTTGPTLGIVLFPEIISSSGRTSSLTTGVIFEFIYNFGLILAGPSIFMFVVAIQWILRISKINFYRNPWMLIGFYWLFGFSMFFDDLGGTVNKFVTLCMTFILIRIFRLILSSYK